VRHDANAKAVLARLSKSGVGCSIGATTPTTLVGTRVIRGGNAAAVVKAIKQQHDWKSP